MESLSISVLQAKRLLVAIRDRSFNFACSFDRTVEEFLASQSLRGRCFNQMRLKINKACDLSSISVLPPPSRYASFLTYFQRSILFDSRGFIEQCSKKFGLQCCLLSLAWHFSPPLFITLLAVYRIPSSDGYGFFFSLATFLMFQKEFIVFELLRDWHFQYFLLQTSKILLSQLSSIRSFLLMQDSVTLSLCLKKKK